MVTIAGLSGPLLLHLDVVLPSIDDRLQGEIDHAGISSISFSTIESSAKTGSANVGAMYQLYCESSWLEEDPALACELL